MGLAQLYYTSCETGLSGFAGFQFNAVTPGVPPDVLRTVESLTSYKPPRWLGARPTRKEIAKCPVNLVYISKPTTILANVVFVGTDFSQRSGNYFAHALFSRTGVDAFEKILPIELWGSRIWESKPHSSTDLPLISQLPEPPSDGPVSRTDMARFLDRGSRRKHLAALVTAAENAVLRGGRSIVIVHRDTVEAARWIAAICFLLPPRLARKLSFATYHHDPGYIDVHVIATLPDSDFEVSEWAFRSYVVLDEGAGRISDVVPEPAADLLVRVGPGQAAALWEHATRLGRIASDALADWHPALVMAAILGGYEVTAGDLDVLGEWLPQHSVTLSPPGERAAVLRGFLASDAFQPRHMAVLAAASRLGDDHELTVQIEHAVVEEELRRAVHLAGADIGTGVRVTTDEGRAFATWQCAERLAEASAPVAIALLGWSTDLGLKLPDATLRACGEHTLGPQLAEEPDEDILGVLAGARPLIEGALAHLAAVVSQEHDAVVQALAAGLDEVASRAQVPLPDALAESALLASVRAHPENRIAALGRFMGRPGGLLSEHLLTGIWPEGRWTAAEAQEAIGVLQPEQVLAEPVSGWIARTVLDPPRYDGYLSSYRQLCQAVEASGLAGRLPRVRNRLDSFADVSREIERAETERGRRQAAVIRQLASSYAGQPPPVQDLLCEALVGQPEKMAGSRHLGYAVEKYPRRVVSAFLDTARDRLAGQSDTCKAARLFRCLTALNHAGDRLIAPGLEDILRERLGVWRRADLDQLYESLLDSDQEAADDFASWRQQHLTAGRRRSWRRLLPGRS
jgi:GTPase-associated protein 1, N-terminal domain type 2/GTPase-associated protein 1, C-terminal domain/GTPase-associated protein 1, middle domain